jgi:hypothetical protein
VQFTPHLQLLRKLSLNNILLTLSLNSYSYRNPSFRIYEMDATSYNIKNYYQYISNLEEANKDTTREPELTLAYDFNSLFNAKHLYDYENIKNTIHKIGDLSDRTVYKKIAKQFFADGPEFKKHEHSMTIPRQLRCRYETVNLFDFFKCTDYTTCK